MTVAPQPPYDHVAALQAIIDSIVDYQTHHADLVQGSPNIDPYWQAGQQMVSARNVVTIARDMVVQGKVQEGAT